MISYEGLLQKLNKGNIFPASLPGWNKSGQKPRFLKTCDIIEVDGKHICGLFSMFGSVRQNRDSDETKFPFFGILWYNKNEEETISPSLCLAAEKMRKICGKNRPFLRTKMPVFGIL